MTLHSTRHHRTTRRPAVARVGAIAMLAAAGVAVGLSAAFGLPRQEQPPKDTPPPPPPAPAPETPPGTNPEELERIMRQLREEAAKHREDEPAKPAAPPAQLPTPIPTPAPVTPPAPKPALAPTKAPAPPAGVTTKGQPDRKDTGRPAERRDGKASPTIRPGSTGGVNGPSGLRNSGAPRAPAAGILPGAPPMPGDGAASAPAPGEGAAVEMPDPDKAISADGRDFTFNFTDEVEITDIIGFVRDALDLQIIATDSGLIGQKVTLMTPITVRTEQVLSFLTSLLEMKGYTLSRDPRGIYVISPSNQPVISVDLDPNAAMQIIPTPGLKPSSLTGIVSALINANRGGAGGPASQPIFQDDLGVIILTDSPNTTAIVRAFVDRIVAEQKKVTITRYPVTNIAAASARDRVIELLGSGILSRPPGQGGANPAALAAGVGGSLSNIPERITLDSSTNALLFRGRPDEGALLMSLIQLVDVPNAMESRWYNIGTRAAETVVDMARRQQLGEVSYFEGGEGGGGQQSAAPVAGRPRGGQPAANFQQNQPETTGAGFVVYPESGGFIYRGTTQQHARVEQLIRELGPLSVFDDRITYEFIKLKHSKAEDVAQTVQDLITGQTTSGNRGALLGRDLGSGTRRRDSATDRTRDIQRQAAGIPDPRLAEAAAAGLDGIGEINSEDVHVLFDEPTNQVVVKAPARLQSQIRNLIDRLDLRRPQVYIEAQIVAVSTGDDFRLAVEVQQIIGQFALNTNFGLGSIGTAGTGTTPGTGDLRDRKTVATNLGGLTSALIRSKDVPFIINTIQQNTDSRIVATPQVLVDDNAEATIESLDQQPTLTTTLGSGTSSNNTTQSFGGFEDAGPRLTIKPQISEGGYLKVEYEIELSSFTGASSAAGVPPPKQTNTVTAESVTVPTDSTIVVGGLTFDQANSTISGIPLLKDIPIIGHLFRDTRKTSRNITLYIFITPRIMRDPSFADLRLLTRQPRIESRLDHPAPPPVHERIDVLDTARADTADRQEAAIMRQREDLEPVAPEPKRRRLPRRTTPGYERSSPTHD